MMPPLYPMKPPTSVPPGLDGALRVATIILCVLAAGGLVAIGVAVWHIATL